jgi:serine/threonine protein kinase
MSLSAARWHVIAESNYAWEREALEWLREHLPNHDPWHVWTNFEFIDDEGRVNEIDALVLAPAGLYAIEIKSRPGEVRGDAHTWVWQTDGHVISLDNPLLLTDRKAKRLSSILKRQPAISRAKVRLPFIEPMVFLSASRMLCTLSGRARSGVFTRGRPGHPDDDGIIAGFSSAHRNISGAAVDGAQMRALFKAIAEAGIRPSNRHRMVGEYRLHKLLSEGENYQDWLGQHASVESVQRRIRIYTLAASQSAEQRQNRARGARREFEVLEGIDHAGILRCRDLKETELGPALIFDHDPKALRLDHLMHEHGVQLSLTQRLSLVRGVAEVLKYAHAKRLYHRALTPQSVLVHDWPAAELRVRLMNWQTGARGGEDSQTLHRTTGTQHVESYVDDPGRVYLAPEIDQAETGRSAELDVFSLGALSYLILSGRAPADSAVELLSTLRSQQGLQLADVMDGCPEKLAELIRFATQPEVLARYNSIDDFLQDLDLAEDELTTPDPEATVDPSVAKGGDRVEGGFTVTRPLGRGSSAVVLLVRSDGNDEQFVLKVAHDAAHNEALRGEGEALAKLRHPNIIKYEKTLSIGGRTALQLVSAGDTTLAQRIKQEGRLSLDMLQRYGEELLSALCELEQQGISHRDIKPENIGIAATHTGRLRLVLFDFSLSRTPPENIKAGTPPYLDPFLALRSHRRWDLYAERYAAAVTLYEMAVSRPPRFGDGSSAPEVIEDEAQIDSVSFDPNLREGLTAFFSKALRRDFRERHDNAEDMLRAWRALFERAAQAAPTPVAEDSFEALAARLTAQSTVGELAYTTAALDVLARMGVNTVRELLGVDRLKFRYLQGVGDRVRREIRLKAKALAQLRPDLAPGNTTLHELDEAEARGDKALVSVNELAEALLPRRTEQPEDDALEYYLGLELPPERAGYWPTAGEAAGAGQITREALAAALAKARERWLKTPAFTELRAQMQSLLQGHGEVMTHRELAEALLALRGSALGEDAARLGQASAVVRAAVEAEAALESPRFQAYPHAPAHLIATQSSWASYAQQLGAKADGCAQADPLLAPSRVLEALRSVPLPTAEPGMPEPLELAPGRLLRLASAASQEAAVSSRQELYRRGMPKLQALKQSLNGLVGLAQIRPSELVARVRGRYPEAEALPAQRTLLERLLEEADAPLKWDAEALTGGAFVPRALGSGFTLSPGSRAHRPPSRTTGEDESRAGQRLDAQALEQRLQHRLREGGLLVLSIEPRDARMAQTELLRRFGGEGGDRLQVFDLDAWWLAALRQQAQALGADWKVVLRADAASASGVDANRLQQLAQRCLPALTEALLSSPRPLLLVNPGLLARFGLMHLFGTLETEVGRPGRTLALWVLLPSLQPSVACIDSATLPLIREADFAPLTRAWLENRHRSAPAA